MTKKPDKSQEQKPAPRENDVLLKMLSTPPEIQKKISKSKKSEK
ncbi:MAG: hypothetical protein ACLQUW_03195 [Desulfobaccales bacterium]